MKEQHTEHTHNKRNTGRQPRRKKESMAKGTTDRNKHRKTSRKKARSTEEHSGGQNMEKESRAGETQDRHTHAKT